MNRFGIPSFSWSISHYINECHYYVDLHFVLFECWIIIINNHQILQPDLFFRIISLMDDWEAICSHFIIILQERIVEERKDIFLRIIVRMKCIGWGLIIFRWNSLRLIESENAGSLEIDDLGQSMYNLLGFLRFFTSR